MKRLGSLAVAVALGIAASAGCGGASNPEDDGASEGAGALSGSVAVGATLVATGNLNLRSAPSTSSSVLHVIPKGATVVAVAGDPSNGFYNVKHAGTTGWASGKYLSLASPPPPPPPRDAGGGVWTPASGTTWQWQLDGTVDTSIDAAVYDIDLFDNESSVVATLHAAGRKVICYVSVGSWENWRPDASRFPSSVLGNDYSGWAGEKWLDVRNIDALAPVMRARFDMCKDKGFDGLEPDNIDGYTNSTGFAITAQDQLAYNRWLAAEAHQRGLSIGLKNDNDQVGDLVAAFDWALTEDCDDQGWCGDLGPFIAQGKAVFMAEYTDTGETTSKFCPHARTLGLSGILKKRGLDGWRQACP